MVPGSIGSIQTTIPFRFFPPGTLQSRSSGGPAKGPAYPQSTEVLDLQNTQLGLSENSVPLNPMVNDHYPYEKLLFHWEYTQHVQTNPIIYHTILRNLKKTWSIL